MRMFRSDWAGLGWAETTDWARKYCDWHYQVWVQGIGIDGTQHPTHWPDNDSVAVTSSPAPPPLHTIIFNKGQLCQLLPSLIFCLTKKAPRTCEMQCNGLSIISWSCTLGVNMWSSSYLPTVQLHCFVEQTKFEPGLNSFTLKIGWWLLVTVMAADMPPPQESQRRIG